MSFCISSFKKVLAITVFIASMCVATQVDAAADYVYKTYGGSYGSNGGEFNTASNIVLDASGNRYVVDTSNNRIQKFTPAGAYDSQFGSSGSGDGEFSNPQGIAIDSSGNIYVADTGNHRIQKFDSSGGYDSQFGSYGTSNTEFSSPKGVAVDSSGNIYVADTGNNSVKKFDSSYTSQGIIEISGSAFYDPSDIHFDTVTGYIYIVDSGNNRIAKFDSSGSPISQFGSSGSSNGEFNGPQGVTTDSSGYIYVADTGNHRIQKFDSSGTYFAKVGTFGTGNGELSSPRDVVVDAQGNLIIVDTGNYRIVEFEVGPYLTQWGSLTSPQGIAYDYTNDYIYVLNTDSNGMIARYNTAGGFLTSFVTRGTSANQIDIPKGIAVDSAGNIYVLDYNSTDYTYSVKKFDSSGTYITKWGSNAGLGIDGAFSAAHAIAIDGRDVVYVTDASRGDIQKFTTLGTFIGKFNTYGPYGLTINKQGKIYVNDGAYTIFKYAQNGTLESQFGSSGVGLGNFSGLRGMFVDSDGNLNVLEEGNHRVQKVDSTQAGLSEFGSSGTENGEFAYAGMDFYTGPRGIVQDSLGFTYVLDTQNGRVQKFRSTVTGLPLVSATVDTGAVYLNFAEDIDPGTFQIITSEFEVNVNNSGSAIASADLYDADTIRLVLVDSTIAFGDEVTVSFVGGMTVIESNESDKAFSGIEDAIVRNTIAPITVTNLAYSINANQTVAALNWTTSYTSNAVIDYGISSIAENSVNANNMMTENTHFLQGLNPNTTYKYRITVTEVGTSNTAQSEEKTFTTNYLGVLPTNISAPRGVAVNSVGDIYVIDGNNDRIYKLDRYGNRLSQFGSSGSGNGQFSNPYDIAIDSSDNLYVSDSGNSRIQKFNSSGVYQSQFGAGGSTNGEFSNPKGIFIKDGYLYIVDYGNSRIQIFNTSGDFYSSQFGAFGSGDGEFNSPSDIGVDSSGYIYVTDTGNNRVQKFNSSGFYQSQFGSSGSGDGQFSIPDGIIVDPNYSGDVYVVDTGNNRVQKYNSSGTYQSQFGTYTTYGGQLSSPQSVAFGLPPTLGVVGDLLVTNVGTGEILRFGGDTFSPTLVSAEIDGNTLELTFSEALENNSPSIGNFTVLVNESTQQTVNSVSVSGSKVIVTLNSAVTSVDGNIYVTYTPGGTNIKDLRGNSVQSGTILNTVVSNVTLNVYYISTIGAPGSSDGEFNGPQGVTVDQSNYLYVVDAGNGRIQKFTPSGAYDSQFGSSGSSDGQLSQPLNVAIGGSGNLYVSDFGNVRVQDFSSGGVFQGKFGSGEFSELGKISVKDTEVYVTDTGNNRIRIYDQLGGFSREIGSSGSGVGQFNNPLALAFNSQGDMYVLDAGNNRVQKFNYLGSGNYEYEREWGASGSANSQFSSPTNIYIDQSDNIYVIDAGNQRIQKFNTNGVYKGKWVYTTAGDTQIQDAKSIAINSDGLLYVSDNSQHIVKKLSFTVPADTTAPTLTSIASSTTQTTATITWDTNEVATSTINYGLTASYGTASSSAVATTTHRIVLTGLTPDTTYHFRISSWDAENNLATSTDLTFTTFATSTLPVGSSPYSSTLAGTLLYVNNYGSNNVTVIDTVTNSIVDIINVGTTPNSSILAGTLLYVNNPGSDNVTIIDTTTNTITNTINVGTNPQSSTLVGTLLYVNNSSSNNVTVIDTTTNTVTNTISVGTNPHSSTLVGTLLYVNNYSSNNVTVIDTTTNTVTNTISVGVSPESSTLAGNLLYVNNINSNNITVIDTTTNTVIDTINAGSTPYSSTLVGTLLYVNNYVSDNVTVIDTTTNTVIDTISVGTNPRSSTRVGTFLYVNNLYSNNVTVIDGATHTVVDTITSGTNPVSSTRVGTFLYVNNSGSDTITIIDTGITPDTTAPTLTSIASSTTQTTATITWATNEAVTSTVNFGLTSSYGTASSSAVSTTTHRFVFSGLTPDATYHFRISSWDAENNLATSSDLTFTTLDATTSTPTLLSPTTGTYTNTTPMSVSFILPETPQASSIRLTFTPTSGTPIVLNLRDAAPSVTNTFSLPLTSGITTTVAEVLSATADTIPVGTYTVALSYQDIFGNPAATASVTGVVVQAPVASVTQTTNGGATSVSGTSAASAGLFANNTSGAQAGTQAGLQNGAQTGTPAQNASSTFVFTRNLSLNNTHAEVKNLQRFLNTHGFIVATTGAGSLGKETTKFGPATRAALIRFQKANKISPAIGFFGPITRAVIAGMR